jgi:hypothetical protein
MSTEPVYAAVRCSIVAPLKNQLAQVSDRFRGSPATMKWIACASVLAGCIPSSYMGTDQFATWQAQQQETQARAWAEANAWQVVRVTSPLDGGTNVHVRKLATPASSTLVVRCEERRLRVGVITDGRLHHDFLENTTPVSIRIGDGAPREIDAEVGPDRATLYLPDPASAFSRMQSARDLAVRFQPAGSEPITVTVDLANGNEALAAVRDACPTAATQSALGLSRAASDSRTQ